MDEYESPTIEPAGGPDSHSEPDGIPTLVPVAVNAVVAFVAAIWEVAILWSQTWTWNN